MSTQSKLPPHDLSLEEVVLGACLLEGYRFKKVAEFLPHEAFYKDSHEIVYKAMLDLFKRKETVDILTVTQELRKSKHLDELGGPFYITQLTNRVGSAANVEAHARILQQHYFRRELIKMSKKLIDESYDNFNDILDTIDGLKKKIRELETGIKPNITISTSDTIANVLNSSKEAAKNGGIIGYSTGFKNIDHGLMGLRPGKKYIIAARPSVGKTTFAKSIAINLAHKQGIPGIFFSMEMEAEDLMITCISEILKISNEDIQKGKLTDLDQRRIDNLRNSLFSKNFIIDPTTGIQPDYIKRRIEETGAKWWMVDYLGLMDLTGPEYRGKGRDEILGKITMQLKNICKETKTPGIEIVQLNREVEKRKNFRPILADLRESGSIEANADVVMFVYRPEYHGMSTIDDTGVSSEGYAEIIIAKNRGGARKNHPMRFIPEYSAFEDSDQGKEVIVTEPDQDFF